MLTDDEVSQLRTIASIRELLTDQALADCFGISKWHVQKLVQGQKRSKVKGKEVTIDQLQKALFGCATAPEESARTTYFPRIGCGTW